MRKKMSIYRLTVSSPWMCLGDPSFFLDRYMRGGWQMRDLIHGSKNRDGFFYNILKNKLFRKFLVYYKNTSHMSVSRQYLIIFTNLRYAITRQCSELSYQRHKTLWRNVR